MNLEKVKKDILGHQYEITILPARHAYSLMIKLTSIIGISLSSFFKAIGNKEDAGLIGEALGKLLAGIHHNDPQCNILLELLSQTTRDGKAINTITFDEFYTGNIEESLIAIFESIKVHFTPFLALNNLSGSLTQK